MSTPENPFRPPSAPVADPAAQSPARPLAVRLACQLLLAALVLSLVTLLPGVRVPAPEDQDVPFLINVVVFGAVVAFALLLIAKSYEGRNWARWTNLAFLCLGWVFVIQDMGSGSPTTPLAVVLDVVVMVLELAATWLLFTGIGHYWFKQMSRASGRG